jgi:hypothetical protein
MRREGRGRPLAEAGRDPCPEVARANIALSMDWLR